MPTEKLPNYLRRYRRQAGLSQEEMAYLVGYRDAALVCRFEQFHRVPNYRIVLAYKVLFGIPTSELFGGVYQKVERRVRERARRLAARVAAEPPGPAQARKLAFLKSIAEKGRQ